MKNNILKFTVYLYYLALIVLLILYLYPGSIIGYLLYGNFGKQPNLVMNRIGTWIKQVDYFSLLTFLGSIYNLNKQKFINSFFFLFTLSIFLEIAHFFIPNRALEFNDIIANSLGVISIYLLFKLKKKIYDKKI